MLTGAAIRAGVGFGIGFKVGSAMGENINLILRCVADELDRRDLNVFDRLERALRPR